MESPSVDALPHRFAYFLEPWSDTHERHNTNILGARQLSQHGEAVCRIRPLLNPSSYAVYPPIPTNQTIEDMTSISVRDFQERYDGIQRKINTCTRELEQLSKRSEALSVTSQSMMEKNATELLKLALALTSLIDDADGKGVMLLTWMRPKQKGELVRRSEKSIAIAAKYNREITVIRSGFESLSGAAKVVLEGCKDLTRRAVSFQSDQITPLDQQRQRLTQNLQNAVMVTQSKSSLAEQNISVMQENINVENLKARDLRQVQSVEKKAKSDGIGVCVRLRLLSLALIHNRWASPLRQVLGTPPLWQGLPSQVLWVGLWLGELP
jgi:hypothetical protein